MVFNLPPLGCSPVFLSAPLFNTSTVDTLGCLVSLNAAVEGVNSLIRSGLLDLGVKHPDATIIYADHYRVLQTLVRNGSAHGFKETFKVCCGAGGVKYNLLLGAEQVHL